MWSRVLYLPSILFRVVSRTVLTVNIISCGLVYCTYRQYYFVWSRVLYLPSILFRMVSCTVLTVNIISYGLVYCTYRQYYFSVKFGKYFHYFKEFGLNCFSSEGPKEGETS